MQQKWVLVVGWLSNGMEEEWRSRTVLSSDVAAEVDGCGSAAYLVGQYGLFVVYTLMDWKPMQLFQSWLSTRLSRCLKNDSCCSVLHTLQCLTTTD